MTPSKTTIAAFADRDLRGESMKKKRIPPWKHEERLLKKVKSRKKNKIHIHVCMGALPNCKNIDSYGVICVECNLCGRFDPPKQEKQDKEETA